MANELTAEFFGTPLTIIDHAGRRWLTAQEVGQALGYEPDKARQGINNLYGRHQDEFGDTDSCVIKLMTQVGDQRRDVRVFSDTGCNMLGFFANTRRAKDFRTWAKRELTVQPPVQPTNGRGMTVRITHALERDVLERFARGQPRKLIAQVVGTSVVTVTLLIHGRYQFAPGAGVSQVDDELVAAVTRRHMLNEQDRLLREQQRIANAYRNTANNARLATALDGMGRYLQQRPRLALEPMQSIADVAADGSTREGGAA